MPASYVTGTHTAHTLNGSTGFIDCTLSTSIAVGNLLIINAQYNSNATGMTAATTTGGLNEACTPIGSYTFQSTVVRTQRLWKIATANDVGGTVRITATGGTDGGWGAQFAAFIGHDPASPINAQSNVGFAAASAVTYTGLTPTVNDCLILSTCASSGSVLTTVINAATDSTKAGQYLIGTSDGNQRIGAMSHQALSGGANQAVGNKTSTIDAGTTLYGVGGMLAIAPGFADTTPPAAPTGLTVVKSAV